VTHDPSDTRGPPPADGVGAPVARCDFGVADLREVRAAVARHTGSWPSPEQAEDFRLAVSEVATNAVVHGGGRGTMTLWSTDRLLACRITDRGPGMPDPAAGTAPPPPSTDGGYGLWLVRSVCTTVDIRTSPAGTRVDLVLRADDGR
jgi:anti-sigma regulatory factor (Ser/Thr protein kinase)